MTRRRLIELSPIEEAMLVWDEAAQPWTALVGVSAPHLDVDRLRAAFDAAMRVHPLTACAVEADAPGRLWWVHDDRASLGEITVVACADDDALTAAQNAELNRSVPLTQAPLLRAVVARLPDHDVVLVTMHHVLCDGLGIYRFLRTVAHAYRGVDDAPPAVDIATAHEVLREPPATVRGLTEQLTRRLRMGVTALAQRSRLAGSGGAPDSPGFATVSTTADRAAVTEARRHHGASSDEHLMAALHVAIERWNTDHGAPSDCVGVTQAVNLRPAEWWDDVVVNLATFVSVLTDRGDRVDVATALARVRPQLEPESCRQRGLEVARAARSARLVPRAMRQSALAAAPASFYDSCVLSNLGALAPPRFADGFEPVLYAATPAMPEIGLTIAVHATPTDVRLLSCYRRELFNLGGVVAFLDGFAATLTS